MELYRLQRIIEYSIQRIGIQFKIVKGLILTESDLKCLIYSKLMMSSYFSRPHNTREHNILSHRLHTELSWYAETGRLGIIPDITILDPRHLSIVYGLGDAILPNKQYSFAGKSIIFELKFVKEPFGISRNVFIKDLIPDFRKINRLYRRLERDGMLDDVFCYFVIFNKTDKVCEEASRFFLKFSESQRHKIIYISGEVDLDNIDKNESLENYRELMEEFGFRPYRRRT